MLRGCKLAGSTNLDPSNIKKQKQKITASLGGVVSWGCLLDFRLLNTDPLSESIVGASPEKLPL